MKWQTCSVQNAVSQKDVGVRISPRAQIYDKIGKRGCGEMVYPTILAFRLSSFELRLKERIWRGRHAEISRGGETGIHARLRFLCP